MRAAIMLPIIDELGYLPLTREQARQLFQVDTRQYERIASPEMMQILSGCVPCQPATSYANTRWCLWGSPTGASSQQC